MRGFSTIEIIIALAIIVTAISAVSLVQFGGEDARIHSKEDAQAFVVTQQAIDTQAALAEQDFNLTSATTSTTTIDAFTYVTNVDTILQPDFRTKVITAVTTWHDEQGHPRTVSLHTAVTNYRDAAGEDTCNLDMRKDWSKAKIAYETQVDSEISDIDVYHGKVYVALSTNANTTALTIFDTRLNKLSSETDAEKITRLSAIAATGKYVYALSQTGAKLFTIDVSNPSHISASTTPVENYSDGATLSYKNNTLYAGFAKSDGAEFRMYDVSEPEHPKLTSTFEIGSSTSNILIRDGTAYIAHPASDAYDEQLTVLHISAPSSIYRSGGFSGTGKFGGNGKSVYIVGDTLYLGRTYTGDAHNPELYILDSSTLTELGSYYLGNSVNDLIVRGTTAFALTSTARQLKLLDVSKPSNVSAYASIALPGDGSAMDCEGDVLYVASNAGSNGHVSVITTN